MADDTKPEPLTAEEIAAVRAAAAQELSRIRADVVVPAEWLEAHERLGAELDSRVLLRLCDAAEEAAALRQRAEAAEAMARIGRAYVAFMAAWRVYKAPPQGTTLEEMYAQDARVRDTKDALDAAFAAEQQPEGDRNG